MSVIRSSSLQHSEKIEMLKILRDLLPTSLQESKPKTAQKADPQQDKEKDQVDDTVVAEKTMKSYSSDV